MNRGDREELCRVLRRLPAQERPLWIAEANRLAGLGERFRRIRPKRRCNELTGRREFVPEVLALCQEARCDDATLLAKEPHRAKAPAPHTLDDWARAYRRDGRDEPVRVSGSGKMLEATPPNRRLERTRR